MAIIGVLVAISIPVFTSQLEKARQTVDIPNMRSAKSVMVAERLTSGATREKNTNKTFRMEMKSKPPLLKDMENLQKMLLSLIRLWNEQQAFQMMDPQSILQSVLLLKVKSFYASAEMTYRPLPEEKKKISIICIQSIP